MLFGYDYDFTNIHERDLTRLIPFILKVPSQFSHVVVAAFVQ